uniref:Inhibitor of growth protein n=1 Tax=Steinernema glaseri TaxID=37863 RepID=A0A1I7ZL75_9BILA
MKTTPPKTDPPPRRRPRRGSIIERRKACRKALKTLDPVLKKKLGEIHSLDVEASRLLHEADAQFQQLCENWRTLASALAEKERQEIKQLYNRALALSNKKVKLADEMYQAVDQVVVKLDIERDGLRDALDKLIVERRESLAAFEDSEPRRRRRNTQTRKAGEDGGNADSFEPFDTSKLMPDIPIDPNEPTYCHCKQVSYGKMVMCDNDKCPIEWFHFKCVGLTASPKGTWYCSHCAEEGDNSKKRKDVE